MTGPRMLIACIGNSFLADEGYGAEVARRLAARPLPPGVLLQDFGVRGLDLIHALLYPYELVILVDACHSGQSGNAWHENPMNVPRMVESLGGVRGRILIIGREPADIGSDEAAVDEAIDLIDSLVSAIMEGEPAETVLQLH